ncbi:MAG: N-formylglutamate amidohydrolase [Beijerinckiaceae bacterium]
MHSPLPLQISAQDGGEAFEVVAGQAAAGVIVIADHASNAMPAEYAKLGLPAAELGRHIAYDIGVAPLVRAMAARLGCPAVLSRFSRLLIDPNRGDDDPTLVMRLSDGAIVPGNRHVDEAEVRHRQERFALPYHRAVAATIDRMAESGVLPAVVSIHSFTPVMKGRARPWHVGVLWDADPRLPRPLVEALSAEPDLVVGDNEPYDGALEGDSMMRHATSRGLAHALIEVRQDLIAEDADAIRWGERLANVLEPLLAKDDMHVIRHHGTRTGRGS